MSKPLIIRRIRSGPYQPTTPRSGSEGDLIWRKRNLVTKGGRGSYYEEVIANLLDTGTSCPRVALSGTISLTAGSSVVTGSSTFFQRECALGQRIVVVDTGNGRSELIVPKRIISDTQMIAARAASNNYSAQTGYRLYRLFPLDSQVGALLWGNAVRRDKGTLLSAGMGELLVDGAALSGSSLTATRQPKISIYNPTTGNYSNYTLGMDTPAAPTLSAVGGGAKGMRGGIYSVVITSSRGATGGYNNPSLPANITITTGQMIRVDMPTEDSTNGSDEFGVWVTTYRDSVGVDLNSFNGPWHFLQNVAVADLSGGSGGFIDLEWLDAEVEGNEIITFNNDPPPEAEFVEVLDHKPVWISCRGRGYVSNAVTYEDPAPGPFIAPAKPNNIEAAPVDIQFSSSPPETIIGALPGDGRIYLLTTNNLQIAAATGRDDVPILIRPFWKDGFGNPEQLILVGETLYGFSLGGPTRSGREGIPTEADKDWAIDVAEITSTWNPYHVLVGYDPFHDCIIFFHTADRLNSSGFWTTRYLMYSRGQQMWTGDGEFSSTTRDSIIGGLATIGEQLRITLGGRGSTTTSIFVFGRGTSSVNWWILPQLSDSGEELRDKTIKAVRAIGQLTVPVVRVYGYGVEEEVDMSDLESGTNASVSLSVITTFGVARTERKQVNVTGVVFHTVRWEGTWSGSGQKDRVDEIVYEVVVQGVRR